MQTKAVKTLQIMKKFIIHKFCVEVNLIPVLQIY